MKKNQKAIMDRRKVEINLRNNIDRLFQLSSIINAKQKSINNKKNINKFINEYEKTLENIRSDTFLLQSSISMVVG